MNEWSFPINGVFSLSVGDCKNLERIEGEIVGFEDKPLPASVGDEVEWLIRLFGLEAK